MTEDVNVSGQESGAAPEQPAVKADEKQADEAEEKKENGRARERGGGGGGGAGGESGPNRSRVRAPGGRLGLGGHAGLHVVQRLGVRDPERLRHPVRVPSEGVWLGRTTKTCSSRPVKSTLLPARLRCWVKPRSPIDSNRRRDVNARSSYLCLFRQPCCSRTVWSGDSGSSQARETSDL
ncbi:hypothetical protein SRHO_G00076230 [Serrasalmus rhombeus]